MPIHCTGKAMKMINMLEIPQLISLLSRDEDESDGESVLLSPSYNLRQYVMMVLCVRNGMYEKDVQLAIVEHREAA